MSMVLESLERSEDAANTKRLAQEMRQEMIGKAPEEDDCLESYDCLVGFQDR